MKEKIVHALAKAVHLPTTEIAQLLEVPPDVRLGDYAFPCFTLAKVYKKSPRDIAKDITAELTVIPEIEKIESAGPYVNFFVNRIALAEKTLKTIEKEGDRYGSSKAKKIKIMIEFSQPNTHKAFHVGHIRGTSLGESIARIRSFSGDKVIRANYSGDTGMHIAKWIWCYQKFHHYEKLRDDESWIASIYVDAIKRLSDNEMLQQEVDEINRKIESKEDKLINGLWKKTRLLSVKSWDKIYEQLGATFDVHFFESEVELPGRKIAEGMEKKGIAKKSDGAVIMDLKEYNLGVWVLLRKDGTVLYSAKDIALAMKKTKDFKADKYLVVLGDEQKLHFEQLIKTLEIMGLNKHGNYWFLTFGMVRLPTGKMSSRTGDNILYSEFMKEVTDYAKLEIQKREKITEKELEERALKISIAAIKYSMLKHHANNVIVFNKEEAMRFEGDTGPYILYSYARAKSILAKATAKKSGKIKSPNDSEKGLISSLIIFPSVVEEAYGNNAPNLIANYAFHLAQTFTEFYHQSQVIGSENEAFRLHLVAAYAQVLKNALYLLGIPVLERM